MGSATPDIPEDEWARRDTGDVAPAGGAGEILPGGEIYGLSQSLALQVGREDPHVAPLRDRLAREMQRAGI